MAQKQLDSLESKLDEVFNKKAPFQIPANGKKSLAGALWWLSLIFGILELWGAWTLWQLGHRVDTLNDYVNQWSAAFGGPTHDNHLGLFFYVALIALAVVAVMSLLAVSGLKAFKKAGWNLLFYALLFNVAYGVLRMFTDYGGFGDLLGTVVGFVIGGYLLFQVRSYFKSA